VKNAICTRTMLPLRLAYAMTVHKCQGLTLPKVVVNLGPKEMSLGLTYVAISRVKRFTDLVVESHDYSRIRELQRPNDQGRDAQSRQARINRVLGHPSQVVCAWGHSSGLAAAAPEVAPEVPPPVPPTPPRHAVLRGAAGISGVLNTVSDREANS
jgi:hypothetical protein